MRHDGSIWLSTQILHDPKIGQLSDRHFRRYIECRLLAGGNEVQEGFIPNLVESAWYLRITEDELKSDLCALYEAGLIAADAMGLDDEPIFYVPSMVRPPRTERDITRYEFNRQRKDVYQRLAERDGEYCQHCGTTHNLSVDHILAIARGGGNEMDNLQLLCRPCNSRKGAR